MTLALLAFALAFVGLGCSDDDTTKPPEELAPPTNVNAVNGDEEIVLSWTGSPDESAVDFAGYEIYRGEESLLGLTLEDLQAHKIGHVEAGAARQYLDDIAENGVLYYYHVRSIDDNDDQSEASNEVLAAGRDEGTGVIIEEFESEGASGFDFSTGEPVALDTGNPDRFTLTDIYLGTGDVLDNPSSALALKSPHLLEEHGDDEWSTHVTQIKELGSGQEMWDLRTTSANSGWGNQTDVTEGNVYAVRTPDNHWGKIWVEEVTGEPGSRQITFRYTYQPTAGLAQF